jgi:hypothetical protein
MPVPVHSIQSEPETEPPILRSKPDPVQNGPGPPTLDAPPPRPPEEGGCLVLSLYLQAAQGGEQVRLLLVKPVRTGR